MSVFNQTYEHSSYIKDLASSQGYGVRLLYDSNKSSLSQRSGFKPGFKCRYTIKHMNSLPCTKDLASSQGFDVGLLYDSYKPSLHQRSGFKPGF